MGVECLFWGLESYVEVLNIHAKGHGHHHTFHNGDHVGVYA